jgi:hypothetical protein
MENKLVMGQTRSGKEGHIVIIFEDFLLEPEKRLHSLTE